LGRIASNDGTPPTALTGGAAGSGGETCRAHADSATANEAIKKQRITSLLLDDA
jgi:hypothetical protein